jgi:hypothetical protein
MSANGSVTVEGISGASLVPAKIPTRLLTVVQIFSFREESKRLLMGRLHIAPRLSYRGWSHRPRGTDSMRASKALEFAGRYLRSSRFVTRSRYSK